MNKVRELPASATEAEQLSWLRETEPVVLRGARMRACPIQLRHLNRQNIIDQRAKTRHAVLIKIPCHKLRMTDIIRVSCFLRSHRRMACRPGMAGQRRPAAHGGLGRRRPSTGAHSRQHRWTVISYTSWCCFASCRPMSNAEASAFWARAWQDRMHLGRRS